MNAGASLPMTGDGFSRSDRRLISAWRLLPTVAFRQQYSPPGPIRFLGGHADQLRDIG